VPGFKTLAQLSVEQINQLVEWLPNIPAGTSKVSFEKQLYETFSNYVNSDLAETIFSLGSFSTTELNNIDNDDLAKQITEAFVKENKDGDAQTLEQNVKAILGAISNINLTYKAFGVIAENDCIYIGSNITSDIRIIFNEQQQLDEKNNAVMLHKLKLSIEENNERSEYYFTLSTKDLLSLKEQVEQAINKDKQIQNQFNGLISFVNITD
jgi:hypothetical protein